ncbi:hypothetical protein ACI2IY_19460 [Lysobacter enzymogenes]|uniref:hypothetical protein n=1 Tax=Lysobacter enzymogenes TaxID=69 RepID=UPI00384EB5F4
MPSVVFESERSQEVGRWWQALPRGQRLALLRSRLRDGARDRATGLGREWTFEVLRSLRRERVYREDPRKWGERDYCEYWTERVSSPHRFSRVRSYWRHSAPNLIENIPEE